MSWNYRIMKHTEDDFAWYGLHEVFYTPDGKIYGWGKEPEEVVGDSLAEVRNILVMMLEDVKRYAIAVLDYDMEPEAPVPEREDD